MDQIQTTRQLSCRPYFYAQVSAAIDAQFLEAGDLPRAHLQAIRSTLDPELAKRTPLIAGTQPLNRYSILPGKTFAASPKSKEKYKILRLVANDVIVQNLKTQKVQTVQIDVLLKEWASQGFQEISLLGDIIDTIKSVLGPVLGVFLTAALISWITEKLGR
jgi:hypothetical protein